MATPSGDRHGLSPHDASTATLRPKILPFQFIVDDYSYSDGSVAIFNPDTMKRLGLIRGDTVSVHGKRHDTIFVCLSSDDVEDCHVQLNRIARNNARIRLGDFVSVHLCFDIEYGKSIYILPSNDGSIEGLNDNAYIKYIKSFFYEAYRPVCKGDTFPVRGDMGTIEFKITKTDPVDYCIVGNDTVIFIDGMNPSRRGTLESL